MHQCYTVCARAQNFLLLTIPSFTAESAGNFSIFRELCSFYFPCRMLFGYFCIHLCHSTLFVLFFYCSFLLKHYDIFLLDTWHSEVFKYCRYNAILYKIMPAMLHTLCELVRIGDILVICSIKTYCITLWSAKPTYIYLKSTRNTFNINHYYQIKYYFTVLPPRWWLYNCM